jgi:degradative hydroxymethylglutaryl-CoA reductase
MIENCIGVMPLPLGLGIGFKVNGKAYLVPMAIEEPSVIAACSSTAKIISEHGSGFICQSTPPVMIGQIQISSITDFSKFKYTIEHKKSEIIGFANQSCQSMLKRGGGVQDLRYRQLSTDMAVVELLVNVCDSMGANIINTICEATAPYMQSLLGQGYIGIKILTNLCTERMTVSSFEIPLDKLDWKGTSGKLVAEKIIEAYRFAQLDQYRATTHNKGIMNGIDAVAIALGQDWRAIESAAHSYAALKGQYKPLSHYWIEKGMFKGRLEIPISVGTKGGAISTNPSYINTHKIMGFPSSSELAQVMVSVGLA